MSKPLADEKLARAEAECARLKTRAEEQYELFKDVQKRSIDFEAECAKLKAALNRQTPIAEELMRKGGQWLGAARNWLNWHKHNGDTVTWGSSDELRPPMTAKEVEDLASVVAGAAIYEWMDTLRREANRR